MKPRAARHSIIWNTALTLALLLSPGCGRSGSEPPPPPPAAAPTNAPAAKSTARTVIDGFTGKTAVEAGLKAKKEDKEIDAKEQRALEEVLEQ